MSALSRAWSVRPITGLSVVLGLMLNTASVQAQGTQALAELWRAADTRYAGVSMDLDPSDNVFEVGYTAVGDVIVTKKLDRDGRLLWERVYDPAERLRPAWIAADAFGNVVVTGYSISGSSYTPSGFLTLKYDPVGTLLWSDFIPGPYAQTVRVKTDADGNAYVAGRLWVTNATGNTTLDFALVKYAPNGTRLWIRTFDGGGDGMAAEEPLGLAVSPDGRRIVLAGKRAQNLLVVAYDADGSLAWSHSRSDLGPAYDVAIGPSGEVVAGASSWTWATSNVMTILKFDASGRPLWTGTYPVGDFVWRIAVDSHGSIAATGVDQVLGGMPYLNWVTVKTDGDGTLLWSHRYDGHSNNDEIPFGIAIDRFDAVYVTGQGGPGPSSGTLSTLRVVTAKYASDGTQQWVAFTDSGKGLAVKVGNDDTIFVFGEGQMLTIRYQETGLPDVPPAAPDPLTGTGGFTGARYAVNLFWQDNSNNELRVDIERCTGAGCTDFALVGRTYGENAVGFQDRAVAGGTTYTYRVRAIGAAGPSPYSNTAQATTPLILPPAAPTGLTGSTEGTSVTLTWTDNSTDESQFTIERCMGTGCTNFSQVNAVYANVTTYTDYYVAGGTYSYRVRAWNFGGYSGYSNVATVVVGGTSVPTAPTGLRATALSRSQIALQWTNTSALQDSVRIERCRGTACTAFAQIAVAPGTATSFVDAGLRSRTVYTYRVRASGAGDLSPYSNTAAATTTR
ncbi:MAG TPA: hypothetical protein VK886_20555 [Vicinamibacterales bacterium]|nr:hypothetical protein [Vicinamibacterales bacterium]